MGLTKSTPRYIVSATLVSDAPKYEFPIQPMNRNKPTATLVVETEQGFSLALLTALRWSAQFSEKERNPVFPKVRYGKEQRMVKRIIGSHAWVENSSHGGWVSVGSLSL